MKHAIPVWFSGTISLSLACVKNWNYLFFKQKKYDMHRKLQHPAHPGATPLPSDKNF